MFNSNPEFAQPQKTQRETIRSATSYAHFAHNQALYLNKAVGTLLSAYQWAMIDYYGKPQVLEIDISNWTGEIGQRIQIKAKDNLMVLSVRVRIRENDVSQIELERGEAVQSKTDRLLWTYTTRMTLPQNGIRLEVLAYDLPGNMGEKSLILE